MHKYELNILIRKTLPPKQTRKTGINKTLYFTLAISAVSLLTFTARGQNLLSDGGLEAEAAVAAPIEWPVAGCIGKDK